MENDLIQLWRLVAELSDQLAHNRAITASLQAQAGSVKSAASHQGTGFALRRFNMHLSQEVFDTELERMNAAIVSQNAELQHDNKQLAALLKEYEQTLENVMSKFRTHAHAAQQHELTITRHYEALLLSRETAVLGTDLAAATTQSHALARMSHLLRSALRAAGGEPTLSEDADVDADVDIDSFDAEDWALERECELSRLEHENRALRRMLGLEVPLEDNEAPPPPPHPAHAQLHLPDAPLVTRKYGRRSGSGSGSFIGGGGVGVGGFGGGGGGFFGGLGDGAFGTFRPGAWADGTPLGVGDVQRDADERVAMYLRGGGPQVPN